MSAHQPIFPAPSSPFHAAAVEGSADLDGHGSPLPEMDTLRMLVSERLTAAVDDILGVFGETVARYREQIDLQRRQLDSIRSEEVKWEQAAESLHSTMWIKDCPSEPTRSIHLDHEEQVGEMEAANLAAPIKKEIGGEDCARSRPVCPLDPAACLEATEDEEFLGEESETDNSEDYGKGASALWPSEEVREPEVESLSDTMARSSSGLIQTLRPLFSCKICGESFYKRGSLMTHAAAHLRDCSVCGKHLEHNEHLRLHLRVHRETSFPCSVCGQSFTLRGNLRMHMRIHSGERPFGCTVCGKSFGRRATLVRHVRSHTGEKPFSCSYCGRGFVEKGNLTVHMRTHTGERPYWCSMCDRRFSQLSCYNRHPCQRQGLSSALNNPT